MSKICVAFLCIFCFFFVDLAESNLLDAGLDAIGDAGNMGLNAISHPIEAGESAVGDVAKVGLQTVGTGLKTGVSIFGTLAGMFNLCTPWKIAKHILHTFSIGKPISKCKFNYKLKY